jgi:hypothetical protein
MLYTVREFVAERLAARPDSADIQRRHAQYYKALAERADRPLRGACNREWLDRLDCESGNLAATMRWHLVNDSAVAPHLSRILSLFWFTRDHLSQARVWVDEMLLSVGSLSAEAEVEVLWTAAVIATDVGDDAAALAIRDRLESLPDRVDDPSLYGLCRLALAGVSAVLGDTDDGLRHALASAERLRGQDEPFWRAVAVLEAGFMETAIGRYDDAVEHLREVRDLGRRCDNIWLAAWSRVQLGTLAVLRDQLSEGRDSSTPDLT